MRALVVIAVCSACGHDVAPATTTAAIAPAATRAPPAVPISDPAEYDIDRISRDAGKAIFGRTGIGDPYRTGVPYPIFLALDRAFPRTFGATTGELAHKFGLVARAPNPTSDDPDEAEGLPGGR